MPTPDPNHPITIQPAVRRWRAMYRGHVIADTGDALILNERGHVPVVYFPRADVSMEYMSRSDRTTYCPFKGHAAYFTIFIDGDFADNAVWTYEEPLPGVELISERLAFYRNQVDIYEVDEARVNKKARPEPVDEVVQHTDAGDGHSQKDHWPPSSDLPRPEGRP
jgi:uncharacterized protein (DUF427 family)